MLDGKISIMIVLIAVFTFGLIPILMLKGMDLELRGEEHKIYAFMDYVSFGIVAFVITLLVVM